jgi:hypothetical protein
MESAPEAIPAEATGEFQITPTSLVREGFRYALHVLAVYLVVQFLTMWMAGRVHDFVLPFVLQHQPTVSYFQFAFSHLFAFSFFPALVIGFVYSEWFRHRVALFAWIVPTAVLAYKFATFQPASIFQNHVTAAFHEYFAGGFTIPEFYSYSELFRVIASNPDAIRGMHQLHYAAPAYAGVGYSIGVWLPIRFRFGKLDETLRAFKPRWRDLLPKKQPTVR